MEIGQKIGNRLWSNRYYYGFVNRMEGPVATVAASLPTDLRVLRDEDIPILFDIHTPGLSHEDISDRFYGRLLVDAGIRTCYVAVTKGGLPCAAVWLISADDNAKLKDISNGNFPVLAQGERLLEGAFTLNAYRNKHIMASTFARVISLAKESGVGKIIAFVHRENTGSMRVLDRSGFTKYVLKREKWFLFFRTLTFEDLPDSMDHVSRRPATVLHGSQPPAPSFSATRKKFGQMEGSPFA